ncbi:MAG: polysaccharide deacetylase family protein [Prevotellaceae bacterium]|jgi:peptidoglycan/xylan/chitin deacetylase (PgdA/CDA1 family)|nr:polysaccharide deacetylase family protein [Prevotellaceae bacterium]
MNLSIKKGYNKVKRKIYKISHPHLGDILMLHRVVSNRSSLADNRSLEITPEFLEQTILKYKYLGYRFVSLDNIYEQISKKKSFGSKFVTFTFDDGYSDNFELAYPIFKKYDCPFAIYVTTGFMDNRVCTWWYALDELLCKHKVLQLSDGTVYNCRNIDEKNQTFEDIRARLFNTSSMELKKTFEEWFSAYDYPFEQQTKKLALSVEQILTLSQDNLCTIAAHTETHPRLSVLDYDRQYHEICGSKKYLEQIIGKEVVHFSYPFGDFNCNSVQILGLCGYKTSTLNFGDDVRKGQSFYMLTRKFLYH